MEKQEKRWWVVIQPIWRTDQETGEFYLHGTEYFPFQGTTTEARQELPKLLYYGCGEFIPNEQIFVQKKLRQHKMLCFDRYIQHINNIAKGVRVDVSKQTVDLGCSTYEILCFRADGTEDRTAVKYLLGAVVCFLRDKVRG